MEPIDFASFFHEKLREKGLSLQKLSEISNISLRHLELLEAGNLDNLPPAPYLRGYLKRLGDILGFDGDEWWEELRKARDLKTSGGEDRLPENRFRKKSASWLWLAVLALLALLYFAIRLPSILGTPELTVSAPSSALSQADTPQTIVSGELKNGDTLLVNGERVAVSADGSWAKEIPLQAGMNTVEITAKKFLGGETQAVRQIMYAPAAATSTPSATPTNTTPASSTTPTNQSPQN